MDMLRYLIHIVVILTNQNMSRINIYPTVENRVAVFSRKSHFYVQYNVSKLNACLLMLDACLILCHL